LYLTLDKSGAILPYIKRRRYG